MSDLHLHYDVFISYSRADRRSVESFAQSLQAAGFRVWFDSWELVVGADWKESIEEAMRAASSIVLCLGGQADASEWQRQEYLTALQFESGGSGKGVDRAKPLIFVLLPGADPPRLPASLQERLWVDLRSGLNDRAALSRLVILLQTASADNHLVREEQVGDALMEVGQPTIAADHFERALRIAHATYGSEHPKVANIINKLALSKRSVGDLTAARVLFEEALAIASSVSGSESSEVALASSNLGSVLMELGDLSTARELFANALDIDSRQLGHNHPAVASRLNSLGLALTALGERESGTARLEEAVSAFRNALLTLGERESGTERLEQAIDAFRNALTEMTRERLPLQWATTQSNLGNALWRLGERENGTERLEEAVTAFRDALTEWTRERVPLQCAMTQNNLGNALWRLGERENGTERLEEAVAAFRNALMERTREHVPLDWAMTQNNLGNALLTLGERENGTERLEEAVTAFRDALTEWTRERVPLQCAMCEERLGTDGSSRFVPARLMALSQEAPPSPVCRAMSDKSSTMNCCRGTSPPSWRSWISATLPDANITIRQTPAVGRHRHPRQARCLHRLPQSTSRPRRRRAWHSAQDRFRRYPRPERRPSPSPPMTACVVMPVTSHADCWISRRQGGRLSVARRRRAPLCWKILGTDGRYPRPADGLQ
jgi:tetratricopeptide (TPR) repeat protein